MQNSQRRGAAPAARPGGTEERAGRRPSFPMRRVLTILLSWMSACWLMVGALLSPLVPGGALTLLGTALLSASPILALARWFGGRGSPSKWQRLLIMRPFWYTQLTLPLLAIAGLLGAIGGLPFGTSGHLGRVAMAIVATLLLALGLAGWVGTRLLVVRRLEALLPQLPDGLEAMRIVQLSDLHVGPHTSRRHLARIVSAVREARPDLIAITGDQVDDYTSDVAHFKAAFGELAAPLGVYAIAGNHDIYAGWSGVRAGLEGMGLRVLVNEAVALEQGGSRFWLAGTGDPAGGYTGQSEAAPDIATTLAGIPPGEFAIVLAHNPALWKTLVERGVPLTLSGHTHYGQLSIPRLGWSLASAFLEHAMGSYRLGESLLYINPGTNFWGIPFRLGALPEVTVLTLRRGEAQIVEAGRG